MPTSVFFAVVYVPAESRWSADEKDMVGGPLQRVEFSFWSLSGLLFLIAVAVLFASRWDLYVETAVSLTAVYSLVCLLVSNEFLLSDWHTE